MHKNRVVITGLGTISGLGKTIPEFWQNVVTCKSSITPIQSMDMSNIGFKNGSEVKNYNPLEYFQPKELVALDKVVQFALIAAREAVRDANIEWTEDLQENTCVITGTSIGGQDSQEEAFINLYKESKLRASLFSIPRIMPNAGASYITINFGITGYAYTISTACASSNHAIGNAFWMLRSGACEMAITGGSETPLSYGFLKAWEALRVVAPDTCRPFSKDRQGMILGEGSAMLVLETLESAQRRGAEIYAEIIGFGMSSDASHITKPNQKGSENAMRKALKDADISANDIDYINAHGTGTAINDTIEVSSIKNIFGEHADHLAISSTKSLHGHALGATSALEAIATTLALKNQVFPPTANFTEKDMECDIDVVANASRKGEINFAISNSFAFGGLNAVVVFRKWNKES